MIILSLYNIYFTGGKCLVAHYGGGSRRQAKDKKNNLMDGMGPYFNEGLYLNTSVGFGYMRKLFYYFVVDDDTLDISIFAMQDPKNAVWTAGAKTKLAYLFKSSYELSYPSLSSVNTTSSNGATSVSGHSVFRRGNASDSTHWTKLCRSMRNETVEHTIKTPENNKELQ